MLLLRVHGKGSIFSSPLRRPLELWEYLPGPYSDVLGTGKYDAVKSCCNAGWLFGATRKQFRAWWPPHWLQEGITWDDHDVSLIYSPPGDNLKLGTQVIFNPETARVLRTLNCEQVIYLTRRDRKVSRRLRRSYFAGG